MDEDNAVNAAQAPVTRLRRRLSVEQSEEVNSPGPSTPTKKRGRLAAKPQLELIVENAPESSTKQSTKKAPLKEVIEAAEEKPITPSRRSTRIKSNTSIVSETTQSVNSPRAKRAARRISQVGSDNESAMTPARQTRRTRKDSTSSIDKLDTTLSTKPNNISQVINEETGMNSQKSNDSENLSLRKSPRLRGKKQENIDERQSIETTQEQTDSTNNNNINDINIANSDPKQTPIVTVTEIGKPDKISDDLPRLGGKKQENIDERQSIKTTQEQTDSTSNNNIKDLNITNPDPKQTPMVTVTEIGKPDKISDDLSDTSLNMIKDLDKKPKNKSSNSNKSTSDLDNSNSFKSKRHRTKSLNAISLSEIKDSHFHSDNEITKKKIKSDQHPKGLSVNEHYFGSGDNALTNQSKLINTSKRKSIKETDLNKSAKNESMSIYETDKKLPDVLSQNESFDVTSKEPTEIVSPQGDKENIIVESTQDTTHSVTNISGKSPNKNLKSKIFFEDSDTDNKSEAKLHFDSEDQCVPVVETRQCEISQDAGNLTPSRSGIKIKEAEINLGNSSFLNRKKEMESRNDSCEPMDVDETLPNNITISEISKLNKPSDSFNRKSIVSSPQIDNSLNKSSNKSKRKTSTSLSTSQLTEKISESLQLSKASDLHNEETIVSSSQVNEGLNKSSKKSKRKTLTSHSTSQNNIKISENLQQNETSDPESQKSIETSLKVDDSINKSLNKSRRKSSNSPSVSQNFEKSGTENKSTLILSQLKDTSSSENTVSKSPNLCHGVLSKSTRGKAVDKEDISADYSTSTPLQQKRFQKLGLQINSSIIDTSNSECKKSDRSTKTPINDRSTVSEHAEQSSSTEEESEIEEGSETEEESDTEEDDSRTKSILLDDEVDVASDDYESGDSRDEEEKQYEAEHEIIEKGETLDSEDEETSYDSDYENDSFVVSSDEEDSDLLSGSGDDLSMSDNELTMSKKSKKKYNERKLKEQKKASKEMFEARHKLDKSGTKTSKKKSLKLESSDDSEDEEVAPMKKQRHRRLISTNDDSSDEVLTNKVLSKQKTKKRLLSESDESVDKEKEITVFNNSAIQNDPLLMQVKEEPKTPIKDLNILTVQINENIEEVEVENNIYTKTNQTLDPLHATIMEDNSSSLSESSEILNNYDSILNQLNTENKQITLKTHAISLNLCKKAKKAKEPIIDELNLTHSKKLKNNKNTTTIDVVDEPQSLKKTQKKVKQDKIIISDDKDSSSDCIDLQLLFSEDSNDFNSEKTPKIEENELKDAADDFIPLKRTPGKINLLSGQDDEQDSNNKFRIIIDTQGTRQSTDGILNVSLNTSTKKNKSKKNKSINNFQEMAHDAENDEDDTPMEIPFKSTKNDKYRKLSQSSDTELNRSTNDGDISITGSAKKKKKQSLTYNEQAEVNVIETEQQLGSAKKKNKTNTLDTNQTENKPNSLHNLSCEILPAGQLSNSKKRKRKSSANVPIDNDVNKDNSQLLDKSQTLDASLSTGRQKKKRKISEKKVNDDSEDKEDETVKATDNQRKKANTGEKSTDQIIVSERSQTTPEQEDSQRKKNKKRKRDDDDENKTAKVIKENSFDKVHISRLSASFLNQLEDKPKKSLLDIKKSSVVSTTTFNVQETVKRKNKPSNFLEESVYLNESPDKKKQKSLLRKPKVLPFVPTAATSESGFTTNFIINVLPQEIKFVAQTTNVTNFKNDYLYGKKIQRLGTYEMYKKQRKAKLSKF